MAALVDCANKQHVVAILRSRRTYAHKCFKVWHSKSVRMSMRHPVYECLLRFVTGKMAKKIYG